jgi:hypothetical protein
LLLAMSLRLSSMMVCSDPHVVFSSQFGSGVAGIGYAARRNNQCLALFGGTGDVLDAARHHEHLACADFHMAIG